MKATNLYRVQVRVVEALKQGLLCYEAAKPDGLEISASTAYRLRQGGEQAFVKADMDNPVKPRDKVCQF